MANSILTDRKIEAIADAIGANWKDGRLSGIDWIEVLEHAYWQGFEVGPRLERLRARIPEGALTLVSLAEKRRILDISDQTIEGGNRRLWFEHDLNRVRNALQSISYREGRV